MNNVEFIISKEFPKKVIPLIDNAKFSIDIIVYDWRWYPHEPSNPVQLFNQAIIRAVRRGVNVRAITYPDDTLAELKFLGVSTRKLTQKNLIHCKLMIIDSEIAILGSHNYTLSAFQSNFEVSVIIKGRDAIQRLIDFYNNIYGTIS